MLVEVFLLTLCASNFIVVHSAEYSAPLQFKEEPSDIQFSSKTSGYLHCVAKATSSHAGNNQIEITWRFRNGSLVRNISNIIQALPNGTLWFKPFERLVPAVHDTRYQCVANLTLQNQAILSRQAVVRGVIVKSFKVSVEDQYVMGAGGTATFSCIYPQEVSSYVQVRMWFADKKKKEAEPSGNLVIHDVQNDHSNKLYYCVVVNVLTKEILASNVAKLFIMPASGATNIPFKFSIVHVNKTVLNGQIVLFECLASRTRNIEYIWRHNDKDIKLVYPYSLVNGRSMRIMNTTLDDAGKYTCIARDKTTSESISSSSHLLVQVPLVFLARPSKICTPYYVNATFPCEVFGYPRPTITWYKNAREIKNNNKAVRKGSSLIITSAWGKDEGIYQCIASNGLETIHQAASLIVGAQAPMIIKPFKAKNLTLYDKLDISCRATGKQQATLFWYRDGVRIEESSDRRIHLKYYHDLWTLQITNVTAADSGMYRCEAMNRAGSNFSEARILVKGPAKVTYVPENVSGLLGKDVSITCKANGFPSAKITWEDNKGYLIPRGYREHVSQVVDGQSTLTIKKLQSSDEGTYKCKAISSIGSPDFSNVYLTVLGAPEETYSLIVLDEGRNKNFWCEDCIKWTKSGKTVKNFPRITVANFANTCLLKITGILGNDAGNYTCHKQTKTGVHQEIKEILVITQPRLIAPHSPNPTDVLEHENVRMTCQGNGFPTPRTIWRHKVGGSFVEVANLPRFQVTTSGSLTILNTTEKDETDYSCEIKNSHAHGADLTITLNVNVPARIVNWQTTAYGVSGNITKLSCEASGDKTLNFTWFKHGRAISENSNVRVQRIPSIAKSTLTFLSTSRGDGGKYKCKVFNSFGSDEKTMYLIIQEKPYPPKLNTTYYMKNKKSITIFWESAFDGNREIESYQVDYKTPTMVFGPAVVHANKTSYKITGLEPYTRYEIGVRARNSLGLSDFSNVNKFETAEDAPSAAPTFTDITPEQLSPHRQSLRIKWKRLSAEDSNGRIQGYVIWFKRNSSELPFTKKTVKLIDGTHATISDLQPYTYYIIKIQAFTSGGIGPNSTSISRRTLEGVPSEPPSNIEVKAKTSTSISLSWKAPPKDSINGELIGYRVYYHDNTKLFKRRPSADTASNQTSLTLQGLGKYTNYTIRIAARSVRGPGHSSIPINVVTDEDIPGPPKDLTATTTSVRSVKLQWSRPDEPNGKIISYKIYYVKNIGNVDKKDSHNIHHVESTSHEFENLIENQTYLFWVCAKTSKGEGNCTDKVMASTSKGPPAFIDSDSGVVTAKWKTTVSLNCRFSGFPLPTISWFNSKKKPLATGDIAKYHMTMQGQLIIHNLQREDSRRYVCKVTNKWGTITKEITLKVQVPPDPPKNIEFIGINSTAVKILWVNGFNGNSIITEFLLKYKRRVDTDWKNVSGYSTHFILNDVESGRSYAFKMRATNEIADGNFSETKFMRFTGGEILKPIEEQDLEVEVETKSSQKTIFKDSAVLGTLIGVCLFIIIVIVVLALLTKFGYSPGSKLAQRSAEVWRWFVAKGISAKDHRRNVNRRSGGSASTDGHLGGSSSSLSQPASNNGSTFSLPRSSSRVTESGYAGSVYPIPLPFGNYTPGPNGGVRASGSSDEGIGPETRSETHGRPETGEKEYCQPSIPPRSSNGTPAPPTLMMSSREYIHPEEVEQETSPLKRQRNPSQEKEMEHKMEEVKANESEEMSPDVPRGKERIFFQHLGHCAEFLPVPVNMSPRRPKYEDGHFIIGPDIDRILAYRPPRCYDSTSSEYSSSRDELAQAYEFGKLHHLDDFYGRPTLESASSSGETASSEKDGICHFTSELSVGRPFLIPVAILPPPPNQRLRTRDRKRNPQGLPLNTYYEKDETLV